MEIVPDDESLDLGNAWTGTVADVIYKGSIISYKVDAEWTSFLVERQKRRDVTIIGRGAEVSIGFDMTDAKVLLE